MVGVISVMSKMCNSDWKYKLLSAVHFTALFVSFCLYAKVPRHSAEYVYVVD